MQAPSTASSSNLLYFTGEVLVPVIITFPWHCRKINDSLYTLKAQRVGNLHYWVIRMFGDGKLLMAVEPLFHMH